MNVLFQDIGYYDPILPSIRLQRLRECFILITMGVGNVLCGKENVYFEPLLILSWSLLGAYRSYFGTYASICFRSKKVRKIKFTT